MRRRDLTGRRFGRLVVESVGESIKTARSAGRLTWNCRCDCGNTTVVRGNHLVSHNTNSCGCLSNDVRRARLLKHGCARHHGQRTPEYCAWRDAKTRCLNRRSPDYLDYGGRGIRICDRWRDDFSAFLLDLGPRPLGMSLDRKDVNGDYEPGNCRWATEIEQANNRRGSRHIETVDGVRRTVAEMCRFMGVSERVVSKRLRGGWTLGEAIARPIAA